jgi:hypothetical protein
LLFSRRARKRRENVAAFRMAGMWRFALCGLKPARIVMVLRGDSVAPSSQMATIMLAAVPLWKVIVGAPTPAN